MVGDIHTLTQTMCGLFVCCRDATKVQLQAAAAVRANGLVKENGVTNGNTAAGQATW